MNELGSMYYDGEGKEQDYKEAVRWYRKGAEAGNAKAMFNLGVVYYNGEGVERDYKEAISWFRKAAEKGIERAVTRLKELGEKL